MAKTTNDIDTTSADIPAETPCNDDATPLQALVRVLKHRAEFCGFIFAAGSVVQIPIAEARRLQDLGVVEIIG